MGREVRRVPAGWKHPTDALRNHEYVPLYEGPYEEKAEEWIKNFLLWENRQHPRQLEDPEYTGGYPHYWDYNGNPPHKDEYMPTWKEEEKTHFQMYETTTEGTPKSPVMATKEELAKWLAENRVSAFGPLTATYEQWLAMIEEGSCISAFIDSSGIRSGVEMSRQPPQSK